MPMRISFVWIGVLANHSDITNNWQCLKHKSIMYERLEFFSSDSLSMQEAGGRGTCLFREKLDSCYSRTTETAPKIKEWGSDVIYSLSWTYPSTVITSICEFQTFFWRVGVFKDHLIEMSNSKYIYHYMYTLNWLCEKKVKVMCSVDSLKFIGQWYD